LGFPFCLFLWFFYWILELPWQYSILSFSYYYSCSEDTL
jgi:hypothetical protein